MVSKIVRFGLAAFAMLVATTSGALAETSATPAPTAKVAQATPAANFGTPPSGQIPILYNDHHVYTRPDLLKQGRVIAALVKGGTILIPLRSMFEQMGATVSYDPGTKTATVSKPGSEVKVTVGKPEVIINGESRPLDVPPMIYQGNVLVPVRVVSEGMSAYVQWVPDQHVVVVRYIPATPPPPPPTEAPPPPPPATLAPSPAPSPFQWNGTFRSYYFTRQNASNNPGTQFNFSPGAKYNSNGVNQASLNSSIELHGDYNFPGGGWYVGGSYFYANPIAGPCTTAVSHEKGKPCVSQSPPNTNPDDTLPGFALSTFPEAYLAYKGYGFSGKVGDQLFNSPWAAPYDGTRLKPEAYQGADVSYLLGDGWLFEAADMIQFENRTSNTFNSNTLLTSFPAGGGGLGANIYVPGGGGINTNGFAYGRVGYVPKNSDFAANGYFYGVSSLLNMWWFDGKYVFNQSTVKPYIALQGGFESNAGASYIGKIRSSDFGVQIGANVTRNVLVTAGFDSIPWQTDNIVLPKGVTCSNSTYQISAKGATLGYFLPGNGGSSGQAGVCFTNPNGSTNVYYGGWASPYTDNYATDPFFTSQISQGMADRRAPGTSWRVAATYTSNNKRWVFLASDAWYNYGNALAGENTNEWDLDGQYHFSPVTKGPYKGLLLRYRYMQRAESNTYCGASGSSCPPGAAIGSSFLGGLPLFKYNRAQLEYDF